jgi:prepilin-type N-terminal cleavage/methylation domain-containing protein
MLPVCKCRDTSRRGNGQGFSLIELLIVIAIILLIAAIAIPNLLRAKIAANEASATDSVRQIATAQVAYAAAYPTIGYSANLSSLGGPSTGCAPSSTTACFIDSVLSSGSKSGYQVFSAGFASGGLNTTFVASSAPSTFNVTGLRLFCIVTDGVLRINMGANGSVPAPDVPTCQAYSSAD